MADYKLLVDGLGYKTGPERGDTAYVDGKGTVHDFSDAHEGEVERLEELGAIGSADEDLAEGLVGDTIFLDPTRDPAGDLNTEEKTTDETAERRALTNADRALDNAAEDAAKANAIRGLEAPSSDASELTGKELDAAVKEAGIEGASKMSADEKREALAAYHAGEEPTSDDK